MNNPVKFLLFTFIGLVIGYFLFSKEIKPTIITKTEKKTDTVYVTIRDTIRIREIQHEYLRDTVLIGFEPKISTFTASKSFLYGNTTVSGEVLGSVLKMDIINDFKIPTITNTITNTTTIIKKPQGLFLAVGVNKQLTPNIGVIFVRDRYLFGLNTSGIQLGYKIK